jgi:hypothetical protein
VVELSGVSLPVATADLSLPAAWVIHPSSGQNDTVTEVVIGISSNGLASAVKGATLVNGAIEVPLTQVRYDAKRLVLTGIVGSKLEPGLYSVHLQSDSGRGPSSPGVNFRVIGRGQKYPGAVVDLASVLNILAKAPDSATGLAVFGSLLAELRSLPLGPNLTTKMKRSAFDEIAKYLSHGKGQVSLSDLEALPALLNHARMDARVIDPMPAPTPIGESETVVSLGPVMLTFGAVRTAGESRLQILPGPDAVPVVNRGSPHVLYDLATSAKFDSARGVEVQIEYETGDFGNEGRLRIYQLEDGRLVDRTARLDTERNLIVARASRVGQFVLATSEAQATETISLRALGYDANRALVLELEGDAGTYEIQTSGDLRTWTPLTEITMGLGITTVIDPQAGDINRRFYRAVRR